MKISFHEIERRLEHFKEICREAGLKLTHQRMEIFREVAQTGDHPDAEKVYQGVRERLPTVSLDTVYRTLWMLNDLELISTMGSSRGRTRFDANLNRHHHFVCVRCGLTQDLYSDKFDNLRPPDTVNAIGIVKETKVEVRGICHQCTEKQNKPTQTD